MNAGGGHSPPSSRGGATEFHSAGRQFHPLRDPRQKAGIRGDAIKSGRSMTLRSATSERFYAKTKMGWKETVVNEQANKDGKPVFRVDECAAAADRRGSTGLRGAGTNRRAIVTASLLEQLSRSAEGRGRRAHPARWRPAQPPRSNTMALSSPDPEHLPNPE